MQGLYAGSEPTHLDLEKLFLLSDSLENLNLYGNVEISEPQNVRKIDVLENIEEFPSENPLDKSDDRVPLHIN